MLFWAVCADGEFSDEFAEYFDFDERIDIEGDEEPVIGTNARSIARESPSSLTRQEARKCFFPRKT